MTNELYGCFGNYGMMNGIYGYGWMVFSWIIGILIITALVLFIIRIIKKMQESDERSNEKINKNIRRKK
jgi:uncharacterized membrane protein